MIESLYLMVRGTAISNIKEVLKFTIPIYVIFFLVEKLILKKNTKSMYKHCIDFCFLGYIITVMLLTEVLSLNMFNFNSIKVAPNVIPLVGFVQSFSYNPRGVLEQMLLNIIFFVLFEIFYMLKFNSEKSIFKITRIAFLFSLIMEVLQYFSGRYADIDDILWNTIGAICGILIYKLFKRILEKVKSEKISTT